MYLCVCVHVRVFLSAINRQTLEHHPLALLALVHLRLAKPPGAKHLTGSVNTDTDETHFLHTLRYTVCSKTSCWNKPLKPTCILIIILDLTKTAPGALSYSRSMYKSNTHLCCNTVTHRLSIPLKHWFSDCEEHLSRGYGRVAGGRRGRCVKQRY